jgi:hypothetical protein
MIVKQNQKGVKTQIKKWVIWHLVPYHLEGIDPSAAAS